MKLSKIKEYPYTGIIHHVKEGVGNREDEDVIIYDGEMDLFKRTDLLSNDMDTTKYIIYIPYKKDSYIPNKGDKVKVYVDKYLYFFDVDNAVISQLGGIEIYVTRNTWDYGI